jgi:TonB-linked SusC/RagA family outer membrane protein
MKKFLLLCCSLVFVAMAAMAQERVVTGKVTAAEDGSSMPGVNVVLKGTTNGAVTDADGNYRISVPTSGGTLQFSFIGMQTAEETIGDRSVIDVRLASDVAQLQEVVVTAQGKITEKRAVGYAVTTVSGAALESKPESDVARILTGKIPGVNITNTGGVSGTGTNIIIRGYTTISGSNQPLFVIDGVPFNTNTNQQGSFADGSLATSSRFLDLDPNNIESINVLRGLAATVRYGEQGKKGVIIITTKSASRSKRDFEINVSQSLFNTEIASIPEYQNNFGNGFDQNFGWFFSNWGPRFKSPNSGPGLYGPELAPHPYGNLADASLRNSFPEFIGAQYAYKAYDNPLGFFRTGNTSQTSVSLRGTKEETGYNASFGYTNENGFTPGNFLKKLNGSVGVNSNLSKNFSIQSTMNFAITEMETPPISSGGGSGPSGNGFSIFSDIFYTPRSIDLLNLPFETPTDKRSVYYRAGNDIQNPLWTAKYSRSTDNVRRMFGQTTLTYQITPAIDVKYRLGLDTYTENQEYWQNKGGVQNSNFKNGLYRSLAITNTIWNHDFLVDINKDLSDKLTVTGSLGVNIRQDKYQQDGIESTNQLVFGFINHANFVNHSATNGFTGGQLQFLSEQIWQAVYAETRIEYNRYLYLNLAARNDWSSTLEKENRSLFYPSVSLSFVPTDAFNIKSEFLNFLRTRVSYGSSAGFPDPYSTRSVLAQNARAFVDRSGNVLTTNATSSFLGNPNLLPELQQEYEAGIEAQFLNRRLGFDVTLYTRDTRNLITGAPLDNATGYGFTLINIGRLNNKGIEATITATPVKVGSLTWNVTGVFTRFRSTVEELSESLKQINVAGFGDPGNYAIEGKPFNIIQGSKVARNENGELLVSDTGDWLPADDIGIIGNPIPNYTMNFINEITWKGLSLTAQIDYRDGGDIYSTTARSLLARGISKDTDVNRDMAIVLPGVKQDGTPNDIAQGAGSAYFNNFGFGPSEVSVYDGTTIRLREISLGYTLPKALISKTPFKQVTVRAQGQNLWFRAVNFPEYVNFDTDVVGTGVGNGFGLEFLTGPSARKYGFTLSATF